MWRQQTFGSAGGAGRGVSPREAGCFSLPEAGPGAYNGPVERKGPPPLPPWPPAGIGNELRAIRSAPGDEWMRRLALCTLVLVASGLGAGCPPRDVVRRVTRCPDEPEWVARGSGEFGPRGGKALLAVASDWQQATPGLRCEAATAKARACLAAQLEAYVEGLAQHLAGTHARYFDGKAGAALEFFRACGQGVASRQCEIAPVVAEWECMITHEMFVLVSVPEAQLLAAYRERVEQVARESPARAFGDRTQQGIERLGAELRRIAHRRARGDLTR